MATICKYLHKGKYYTRQQLSELPEFKVPFATQQMEREFVINNTDVNTNHVIHMFPSTADEQPEQGAFAKFIQFKKSQLKEYQKRLNKIEVERKKRDVTTGRLIELNKLERELKLQTEGNFELGIKGLKQEIAELEKSADTNAVGYYAEKDLIRLEKLTESSDIDNLNEAQRIIDFYDLAGTFRRGVENPFFKQEEIFLEDEGGHLIPEYRLSDQTMSVFKGWKDRAMLSQNILDKRKEDVTTFTINQNANVKKMYGSGLSLQTITNKNTGLKDTDWISMWTMDITNGLFSTNGIIPQVMFSYLSDSFEKKLSWAREIEEKIDKMSPGVQKELIKLGYSLRNAGILGIRGGSYQIFKEITKEGNETGGLVQRYIKEFFDSESSARSKFHEKFSSAMLYIDYALKAKPLNNAFEEFKKWRRNSTIIMDINKVPELMQATTPEADAYKSSLIAVLGQKGYDQELEKQKTLLRKYESDKQSTIETLLVLENKTTFDDLSDKAKSDFRYWEHNHSPYKGIEDYHSVSGLFFANRKSNSFMDYNSFIPRKFKVDIKANPKTNQYEFTDTSEKTGYYDTNFETIENNPVLSEFYDVIKEICDTVRENMPLELQQKMTVNTLPALLKTSTEMIADKNTNTLSALFQAFRNLIERIRIGFGVMKQSEISYATVDPITGRANYKVNDSFLQGNTRAVSERMTIEKYKFMQIYNARLAADEKINSIRRFTTLTLSKMSPSALVMLANYLHVDITIDEINRGDISKIRNITGDHVEIGKYIRDYSLHSVVQSQSFDLAKIGKYFSNMVMSYAARQEALPILEVMKKHYEAIRKPKTNNLDNPIYNVNDDEFMKEGFRTNANKQMDDWFERVALDNYGTKHLAPHGIEDTGGRRVKKINDKIKRIDDMLQINPGRSDKDRLIAQRERLLVKRVIPYTYGKDIYTTEEKKKIAEIETLLKTEIDPLKREELIKIREGLGKIRTATAFFDNMWSWIRTLRLGYNVSSATTNFLEGVTSNMIIAASGDYFDPKEIYYGYNVVKHSVVKNVTFGYAETGVARKNRKLMDKYNVIMDSKNELQKSNIRTYASKFSWLNPHALNQRVEYINQSPIMIAMLRTEKIKSSSNVESSIWDAMDENGKLKSEFRTPENLGNWEELTGTRYLAFKQKLHKAIVLGHGNYHDLRGMMLKSSIAGKALAMFKTWVPMQFYWRIGTEQDDIQSGQRRFKGRYWSYGAGSAATHLGVVALSAFGPLGGIVGGAIGYGLGKFFGTDSGVGLLREIVQTNIELFKKAIGMPINLLTGRQLINTDKAFNNWVGKGEFTPKDAQAMRGNMADIAMQLAWLALILLTKSWLWDDDDKPDDPDRIAHNILVNRLMTLSSQAGMYVNPVDTYGSTIGSNAVIQYCVDLGKELGKVSEYLHGRDIISSGINAGESGLWNQTKKTFMPGIFKDKSLGFETQAERVFEESPFHPYFKSDATVDKEDNKRDRAARRNELEEQGLESKVILRQLNEELPTPTRLKELGMTREEYEESRKQ